MAWDQIVELLLDPRLFLLPAVVLSIFITILVFRKGSVGFDAWARIGNFEAFLVSGVFGTVYGPQWLVTMVNASRNSDLSITWESVIVVLIVLVSFVALALAIRGLSKVQGWQWVTLIALGYTIGSWTHVIITKGEPFRSWA